MTSQNNQLLIVIIVLIAASLACNLVSGKTPETQSVETPSGESYRTPLEEEEVVLDESEPPVSGSEVPLVFDSEFPLPEDVENFIQLAPGQVNFQTNLSLQETIDFYRQEFAAQGLVERKIVTTINEDTFSMVFDGSPNGKALVIQGVILGGGVTNINIRYEDV